MQGNENIMFCSRCGIRNNIMSTFCSECGNELKKVKLENKSRSIYSRRKNIRRITILLMLGMIFLAEAVEEIPSVMEDLLEFDVIGLLVSLAFLFCDLAGLAACILTGIRKVKNNDNLKRPIIKLLIRAIISIIVLTLLALSYYSYDMYYVSICIREYTGPYLCIYVILLVSNIYKKK